MPPTRRGTPSSTRTRHPLVRWTGEVALLVLLYGCYMAVRAAMGMHTGEAHHRGQQILDAEALVGLDIERPLNAVTAALPPVGLLFAFLYATLHYLVTPVTLVWIALRRSDGYGRARNSLLLATSIAVLGYWLLPTAPPRLLDAGFTDIMSNFSGIGWWGDAASAPRGMEGLSNQFAAFPSMHVGWAMWVALCLREHVRNSAVRRWAWAYPLLMSVVVMATANHYLFDALAGIGCVFLGHRLAGRWERRRAVVRCSTPRLGTLDTATHEA